MGSLVSRDVTVQRAIGIDLPVRCGMREERRERNCQLISALVTAAHCRAGVSFAVTNRNFPCSVLIDVQRKQKSPR